MGLVVSRWANTIPWREMLTWLLGVKPFPPRCTISPSRKHFLAGVAVIVAAEAVDAPVASSNRGGAGGEPQFH